MKFKKSITLERLVVSVEVSDQERKDFLNGFHKGERIIEMDGKEHEVTKVHPQHKHEKHILKLTIKP